jgi:hypothetical protein
MCTAVLREAQSGRDKKNLNFFFSFHCLSGKLGPILKVRAAITFFVDITVSFVPESQNPVLHNGALETILLFPQVQACME